MCALPYLAWAYDQAGEPDSALAIYERYIATPYMWRLQEDSWWLYRAYERLGDLYEQRGDTAKAVYYYGKLVELWKDADPELQPRVEAARRAIVALSPDT
jgi:tetratricopeptide (TPR) repeat protein